MPIRRALLLACSVAAVACSSKSATGGHDGGAGSDGGAFKPGAPITATAESWTFIPFADAFCADGSTTGIGVNLTTKSTRVLIYLEGGGACWDELTCYTVMSAANFTTGYGATQFMTESTSPTYLALPGGFFDRTAAANPFKDYSYVYVPYCTGDVHAGNNVVTYGAHTAKQVGFANMTAYLARIVPTFPNAERVYLSGSSAGGFGALVNWWQTQQAFGKVRVDLIDDSGTPMPKDVLSMSSNPTASMAQRTNWNLAATLPSGCSCSDGIYDLFAFYGKTFPSQRAALLTYQSDSTLPSFDGITAAQFTSGLGELETAAFAPNASLRYFEVGATGHVLFFSPTLQSKTDTLQAWLTQMTSDAPAWASEGP